MITMASRPRATARDPFYPFMQRALPVVHEYLWRRLPDRRLAPQLTRDVFADALRLWPLAVDGSEQVAFAIGLARRRLIREYGRPGGGPFARAADQADGDRAIALRALGALSPRQRQAALIHRVDGLDSAHVARLLGCRQGTAQRLVRRSKSKLSKSLDPGGVASQGVRALIDVGNGETPIEPPPDLLRDLYSRLAAHRTRLAMSGHHEPARLHTSSAPVAPVLVMLLALVAAVLMFTAPQPSPRAEPDAMPIADLPRLSAPGLVLGTSDGPDSVTVMPIYPPALLPFEIIAVEQATGSFTNVDFAAGVATVYESGASLLARRGLTSVTAVGDKWLTQADNLVWWFDNGLEDAPAPLLEADLQSPAKLEYVVAVAKPSPEQVWAVQPGPGYRDFDEPSIVRRIPVADPSGQTITMAPSDVRPVVATEYGLLLNQSGWIEVGTVHIEDPATRKMMLVAPDGRLMPLWSGLGIDMRADRLVWADCLTGGEQCRVVVSEIVKEDGGYARVADRIIGDSAVSLLPLAQPGIASVSPDGRWLVAERRFTDGRLDASLVLVDLSSGEVSEPLAEMGEPVVHGPTAVWSRDGQWLAVAGAAPAVIRVSDRFRVDLWSWIPAGTEIRAVASR